MDQDELVERVGGNPSTASEKPKVTKHARRAAGAKAATARSAWLKPLDAYTRQQRCEFQVMRFG
jgi:hypothetical protein